MYGFEVVWVSNFDGSWKVDKIPRASMIALKGKKGTLVGVAIRQASKSFEDVKTRWKDHGFLESNICIAVEDNKKSEVCA